MSTITWRNVSAPSDASLLNQADRAENSISQGIGTIGDALSSLASRGEREGRLRLEQDAANFRNAFQDQVSSIRAEASQLEQSPIVSNVNLKNGKIDFASKEDYLAATNQEDVPNADELYRIAKADAKLTSEQLSSKLLELPDQKDIGRTLASRARELGYNGEEADALGQDMLATINQGRAGLNEYDQFTLETAKQSAANTLSAAQIERDRQLEDIDQSLSVYRGISELGSGATPEVAIINALRGNAPGGEDDGPGFFNDSPQEDQRQAITDIANTLSEKARGLAVDNENIRKMSNRWGLTESSRDAAVVPSEVYALAMQQLSVDEDGELNNNDKQVETALIQAFNRYDQYRNLQQRKFDVQDAYRKQENEVQSQLLRQNMLVKEKAADRNQQINLEPLKLRGGFTYSE
tara:strand:- start:16168 stop:17394 length:1227 start_codon:yes stop_codon:yes gene_type:complete